MDLQSVRGKKAKQVLRIERIKGIDILSFMVLASTISVYAIALVLPSIDQVVRLSGVSQ